MGAREGLFISTAIARGVITYGIDHGIEPQTLHRLSGLPSSSIGDPKHRMPLSNFYSVWEHVVQALDDPAAPIAVVRRRRLEDLHVLGFVVMSSESIRVAIERVVRFQSLLSNVSCWSMVEEEAWARVSCSHITLDRLGGRLSTEAAVCMFAHSLRQVYGGNFPIERVSFSHRGPRDTRAFEEFFEAPVEFGAETDGFSFSRYVLDAAAPPLANPQLSAFFEDHANQLLATMPAVDLVSQTRGAIAAELEVGEATMPGVARRLGTSPRTLRRQLKERAASFRELVEDVRKQRAAQLLRRPKITLEEVALKLGFSEISAFSRAFKRWFGTTPGAFRTAQQP